jgi:acetyl esterase
MSAQDLHLDPAIVTWAMRTAELSRSLPGLTSADFPTRRAAELILSDTLAQEFAQETDPSVTIEEGAILTSAGGMRMRRYVPESVSAPAPTQVFLHGGGFVSGSVDEVINDRLLTHRAHLAGIQIISIDYRLAPEHPYPDPVDDAIAAVDALRHEPERYGVDVSKIGIGGASAGAGIAASAVLHLRDRGDHALVHQALEVPALALAPYGASAVQYAHGYGLDGFESLGDLVLVGEHRTEVNAQPLLTPDLSGLPPTFIQVAEHDPLRDGGIAYGDRLRDAGVVCEVNVGRGHVHGSPGLTATFALARSWQQRAVDALRAAYHVSNDV